MKSSPRILTVTAHAVFVPVGVITVLLGPLLPSLSAKWSLSYVQAGALFTLQFVGATLGVALSGILAHARGFRFAIVAGLIPLALGVFALTIGSRSAGLFGIALYGIGLGLTIPACNLLVAELNSERRSAALNLLNFSWSAGAVSCPFLVAAAVRGNELSLFLYFLTAFIAAIAIITYLTRGWSGQSLSQSSKQNVPTAGIHWTSAVFVVFCLLFFLYVGIENAVGGWAASYAKHLSDSTSTLAIMTPSFFYVALMAGRWLAPLLLRIVEETKLARLGIAIACVGMGCLVASRGVIEVILSVIVVGAGLAAVYPITISLLTQRFGPASSRVGSVMFTMANLGGATLPWLVGFISSRSDNLKIGLATPLIAGAAMLLIFPGRNLAD